MSEVVQSPSEYLRALAAQLRAERDPRLDRPANEIEAAAFLVDRLTENKRKLTGRIETLMEIGEAAIRLAQKVRKAKL